MLRRRFLTLLYGALLLTFTGLPPCEAEPDTRAKAQVFSRELEDGARLEFVWDDREKVPFSIEKDGSRIVLHFEEPVALRWSASLKALSSYVKKVETRDGGNTVILTLGAPADPHYYLNTSARESDVDTNGLDLVKVRGKAHAPQATMDAADTQADDEDEAPAKRPAVKQDKKKKAAKLKQKERQFARIKEAEKLAALAPAAGGEAAAKEQAVPAAAAPVNMEAKTTSTATVPAPAIPVPSAAVPSPPIAPATQMPAAAPMPPPPVPAPAASSVAPTAAVAAVVPDTVILPLPVKSDDPTAVFAWKKRLWIVTESTTPPIPGDLLRAGGALVTDAKQLPDPHATIISLPLTQDVAPAIEKTLDDRLRIVLQKTAAPLAHGLNPVLGITDKQASLTIRADKAAQVVNFEDPQTGLTLKVIPLPEAGTGMSAARAFVDFTLLPTAQGIALEQRSDALAVTANGGSVTIGMPGGLAVSQETQQAMQEADSEAAFAHLPPTLFPYARWKLDSEKDFVPTETKYFEEMALGSPQASQKARLKLLHLYLSEGMFPEAIGMADEILRNGLRFYQDDKVSALRGAAEFFEQRIDDARRDFSAAELAGDPEAAMWRDLSAEMLGEDVAKPFRFTEHYDRYISHYPPPFITKLAVIAADRAISRKEYDEATSTFALLRRDSYDEPIKKYLYFMQAKILAQTHDEAEAIKIWEDLARDTDDRLVSARSEYALVNLQLHGGKITADNAIRRLEKLRLAWRGDSLELDVLTRLGSLYLQDKQYDKALNTMRDIVLYYPQAPQAITTARKMEDIFVMLYNKGGAEAMPPLEALALFYEFRDLVPLGEQGDQMIRNLADRLVSIDLLDRAALLLDHQIRNRLQGEDRSRIASKLAQIYLMNHEPEKALDILKTTGYGNLPADLQLERLRLTAQALAQQGQTARAINVLSTDNSPEGTLLRLSIYWDNKDWPNVVSIAEDILGNRNDPGAPLTPDESGILLKLATAYVYEHETGQLQYLRDYFTPLMKNSPDRASFQFITSESGTVNYDNLAGLDQDINAVKSFIASSQDKPGKNGLSKAAN